MTGKTTLRRLAGTATVLAVAGLLVGVVSAPAAAKGTSGIDGVAAMGWGFNGAGGLGDSTTVTPRLSPVAASGLANAITQVSSGNAHSLAVRADGTAWAWGGNESGELGDGTTTDRSTPVQVPLSNVTAVAAGWGFSLALRSDGTVWGWGQDSVGELGDGAASETPRLSPVPVTGLTGVTRIAAGASFGLALLSDGTMRAWGLNTWGQLGVGRTHLQLPFSTVPLPVLGLTGVTQISAGSSFGLALLSDGTVRDWGENTANQLGDGTTITRVAPVPVPGLTGVTQVAGGWVHGLAVLANGTVRGWGSNRNGELGDGTTTNRPLPVPIAGLSGVTQVSGGLFYSLALHGDGTVAAWGSNRDGELGTGDTQSRLVPVPVPGLNQVQEVSAGRSHSLARVAVAAFDITLDRTSGSVRAGNQITAQLTLTALNGFTGNATLTATGLPGKVSASFSPGQASAGSPVTLTLTTSAVSPTGTFPITITATSSSVLEPVRTLTYQLTITA